MSRDCAWWTIPRRFKCRIFVWGSQRQALHSFDNPLPEPMWWIRHLGTNEEPIIGKGWFGRRFAVQQMVLLILASDPLAERRLALRPTVYKARRAVLLLLCSNHLLLLAGSSSWNWRWFLLCPLEYSKIFIAAHTLIDPRMIFFSHHSQIIYRRIHIR